MATSKIFSMNFWPAGAESEDESEGDLPAFIAEQIGHHGWNVNNVINLFDDLVDYEIDIDPDDDFYDEDDEEWFDEYFDSDLDFDDQGIFKLGCGVRHFQICNVIELVLTILN